MHRSHARCHHTEPSVGVESYTPGPRCASLRDRSRRWRGGMTMARAVSCEAQFFVNSSFTQNTIPDRYKYVTPFVVIQPNLQMYTDIYKTGEYSLTDPATGTRHGLVASLGSPRLAPALNFPILRQAVAHFCLAFQRSTRTTRLRATGQRDIDPRPYLVYVGTKLE